MMHHVAIHHAAIHRTAAHHGWNYYVATHPLFRHAVYNKGTIVDWFLILVGGGLAWLFTAVE
ncbi:MAG TPA: hypothetical protein PKL14_10690 [Holophaga sp.]|jgi:hypothetical protein|nr:hypothetical protein [Holophaga sp.]